MSLIHIPLQQINEATLQNLIAAQTIESLSIEYKRQSYGTRDQDKKEFLADLSSFANAEGGDILIGMAATGGRPTAIHPITEDVDALKLRLEQMARDGLQPRIPGLIVEPISVTGGSVVLIRIPRSYLSPHRIIFAGTNRFWSRSSGGKFEPNVDELRTIFTAGSQIADKIRDLRIDRTAKIEAGLTPVPLTSPTLLVLHIVPYSAFTVSHALDIDEIAGDARRFPPLGRGRSANWNVNMDGLLTTSHADANASAQPAYTQVYRSGIIEAVSTILNGQGNLVVAVIDAALVEGALNQITNLNAFGVNPPYAIVPSLVGVSGCTLISGTDSLYAPAAPVVIRHTQLHFIETVAQTVPANKQELAAIMKPALEQTANAAGLSKSMSFDDNGVWRYR